MVEFDRLKSALNRTPVRSDSLSGGCIANVFRIEFDNGEKVVVKSSKTGTGLGLEGEMLEYLGSRSRLPVPKVLFCEDDLLVMTYIECGAPITPVAQEHAADLLVDFHGIQTDKFGFDKDTLIASLRQPNLWTDSWINFFRDHRLVYMAETAFKLGQLKKSLLFRLEKLAANLDQWLIEPPRASLIHGDLWSGNILCKNDRIVAFVDPAIYFGDPEVELAFSTLFGTFGQRFFDRYQEHIPLLPGFFEERRDIYNLYPLLVHVSLFGGSYTARLEQTLIKFGF